MSEITKWISVADASILLKIRPSTVIRRAEKGILPARIPEDMPFTQDGKPNYEIRLDALPQRLQYQYLYSHLPARDICSVDLVTPRSVLGNVWLDKFLDIASIIRDAAVIRQNHHNTGKITEELRSLAKRHGISLATLYRLTGKPSSAGISALFTDPVYLRNHLPATMCLWSCDFAFALFFDPSAGYSQNDILAELEKKRNHVPCTECPYYPGSVEPDAVTCVNPKGHMVIPNHRKTINRLLSHIPPQMILFARKGYREWRAKYGLFVVRERPLLVNESWQGDHHKFDLFVRITLRKNAGSRIREKEIPVRPSLTAWMDSASGCIIGWVISVMPNSDTIAEAFCRAAVLSPGSPFHGLPKTVIIDCGKDYKSKLLEDLPAELSLPTDTALNRRFGGMGLLPALGVNVHHALPYHPQSKPIERFFETLESKWISKLSGWCRSNIAERPDTFQNELTALLQSKKLLTLEEFASLFQNTILPEYHSQIDSETVLPDSTFWYPAQSSMPPLQRYHFLEKAKTVTPDWSTISILKLHHSANHIVGRWGIRFCNTYYQADELAGLVGQKVDFLYHSVQPPYAPASVTVIHNKTYLCEAFPAETRHLTGDSPLEIMHDVDRQNRPAQEMKTALTRIRQSAESILPDKAKSSPSERNQIYDLSYAPAVDAAEHSTSTSIRSAVKEGLTFLFGDE